MALIILPPGISEGTHTFNVVAVDLAGNRTVSLPAKTFTIDNTNPVVAITSPQNNTTTVVGAQITGAITDVNPSPNAANVYFSYNGVRDTNPVTLDATNRVVTSVIPVTASGTVTVTLTATDKAGNTGVSAPITITLSTQVTALSEIDAFTQNPADGTPVTRRNLLPATQTYIRGQFSVIGTVSGVVNATAKTLQSWKLNLVSVADLANPAAVPVLIVGSGTSPQSAAQLSSFTPPNSVGISDGAYYLRLDLTDVNNTITVGTVASGTAAAVTVDNTPPAITSADVNGVNGLFFNNAASPKNLAGTYTDANPNSAYLLVDNALYPNSAGTAGTSVSQSTAGLAEGPHTFSVVALDKAGNRTVSILESFYVDNTPISITSLTVTPSVVSSQTSAITTLGSAANGSALLIVGGNNLTVSATLTDNTDPRNRAKWAIEFFHVSATGAFETVRYPNGTPVLQGDKLIVSGGPTTGAPPVRAVQRRTDCDCVAAANGRLAERTLRAGGGCGRPGGQQPTEQSRNSSSERRRLDCERGAPRSGAAGLRRALGEQTLLDKQRSGHHADTGAGGSGRAVPVRRQFPQRPCIVYP